MEFFGIAKFFINEKRGYTKPDHYENNNGSIDHNIKIFENLIYGDDVATDEELRVLRRVIILSIFIYKDQSNHKILMIRIIISVSNACNF